MPSPLIARKSGIHRAACFALFRALFRQINRLKLGQLQQSTLKSRLRKGIRDNLHQQSNPSIVAALRQGYGLLKILHDGVDQPPNSPIHALILATVPSTRTSLPDEGRLPLKSPSKATKYSRRGPVVWPQPNTPSIFDRPFPHVSGRRRVPRLVITNGFPFLRIKKPQSPHLGRIIRDDILLFRKRITLHQKLKDHTLWGLDEDAWDGILESKCGIRRDEERVSWSYLINEAAKEVSAKLTAHRQKRVDMARRMQDIVDKEQALADQERMQRRNEKHQERKRRRLERRRAASNEAV